MYEKQVMNFDHRQSITSRTTQSTFCIKLLLITQSVTSAKKNALRQCRFQITDWTIYLG